MTVSSRESSVGPRPDGPLPDGEDDPDFVRALARGLAVLETFDADHVTMTLSEVSDRVALSRGSTRRLLLTLAQLGYVGMAGSRVPIAR
jgi:IclR family pca regulon transcriptional regulator